MGSFSPLGQMRQADDTQTNHGHGRIERREVWIVDSRELTDYLAREYHWAGVLSCGLVRRSRKHNGMDDWETQETHTWVSSLAPGPGMAHTVGRRLRGHWAIENSVFRVRDVSYDEDRLHGRSIAFSLSALRNVAINIVRAEKYPYIPDGWRDIACKPDHGLSLLYSRL